MSNSTNEDFSYGVSDSSYIAAGKELGLRKLCSDFYTLMDTLFVHVFALSNKEIPQ